MGRLVGMPKAHHIHIGIIHDQKNALMCPVNENVFIDSFGTAMAQQN